MRRLRVGFAALVVATLVATALAVAPTDAAPTVQRRAGSDRYGTAAAVSAAAFSPGAPVAYVATGEDFPDALAAGPPAAVGRGPVLLTRRDTLPTATETELDRLRPGRIVVIGGSRSVSDAVLAALRRNTDGTVERVAGADRYATAAAASAAAFGPGVPVVYVATGTAFPDALAGGAAGAATGGPVLLVTRDAIPAVTGRELQRLQPKAIHVLGGVSAVSAAVESQLRSYSAAVGRSAGSDRYGTAVAVSVNTHAPPRPTVFVATGLQFADALAAGPAAGLARGPVLLVPGNCMPQAVRDEITRLDPATLVILGGTGAVSSDVERQELCTSLSGVRVALTRVASLSQPLAMDAPAGDNALYIAEKTGRIRAIRGGVVDATPVLDLTGQVALGSEQGLLGLAFSPDRTQLYVDYTDKAGDTHIVEYPMAAGRADTSRRRELLFVDQPFPNHNGGQLVVTTDGRLWIALGDGGGSGDPFDNAQSRNTLLGKILRVDPRPSGSNPYSVPSDNPFVGVSGARAEIWSYGLRNPWRFSFDRATGDMWIGDVGESAREEVDFEPAGSKGRNYGWNHLEGTRPYEGTAPPDAVPPILEYAHGDGSCSVTGGFVYRGTRIPGLDGAYVYGDYCLGRLLAARQQGGRVVEQVALGPVVAQLSSFGQDQAGELYALSLDGDVFRLDPG